MAVYNHAEYEQERIESAERWSRCYQKNCIHSDKKAASGRETPDSDTRLQLNHRL